MPLRVSQSEISSCRELFHESRWKIVPDEAEVPERDATPALMHEEDGFDRSRHGVEIGAHAETLYDTGSDERRIVGSGRAGPDLPDERNNLATTEKLVEGR